MFTKSPARGSPTPGPPAVLSFSKTPKALSTSSAITMAAREEHGRTTGGRSTRTSGSVADCRRRRTVKDAEYHARRFLETLPPAYLYRGEIWLYVGGIWQAPDIEDLKNLICKSLMRVFGEYADWLRQRKSKAVVPSVTESFITNVLRCLKSILPEIPRQWEMPCWIDGRPAKVLVVENGILDLETYKLQASIRRNCSHASSCHINTMRTQSARNSRRC